MRRPKSKPAMDKPALPEKWFALLPLEYGYFRSLLKGVAQYLDMNPIAWLEVGNLDRLDQILANSEGAVLSVFGSVASQRRTQVSKLPVVNVSAHAQRHAIPTVISDNAAVGRLAAEHLLDAGFGAFAFVGRNCGFSDDRYRGFADTLALRGKACSRFMHAPREFAQQLGDLARPLAILADEDVIGRHVIHDCRVAGLTVPGDVVVVGVNNDPVWAEMMHPHLSSVDLNAEKIGYEAARLMHRLLLGEAAPSAPVRIPPKGLVVRESSDALAVSSPVLAHVMHAIRRSSGRLSVAQAAAQAHVSRRVLLDLFRRHLNTTVHAAIVDARLAAAKRLLIETNTKVMVVAEQCSFSHYGRFHGLFRRKTGQTPAQFRATRRPQ